MSWYLFINSCATDTHTPQTGSGKPNWLVQQYNTTTLWWPTSIGKLAFNYSFIELKCLWTVGQRLWGRSCWRQSIAGGGERVISMLLWNCIICRCQRETCGSVSAAILHQLAPVLKVVWVHSIRTEKPCGIENLVWRYKQIDKANLCFSSITDNLINLPLFCPKLKLTAPDFVF